MIARYTRPEMAALWTSEARFQAMLDVEICVAEVQAELGIIPREAAVDIRAKARVDVAEIDRLEQTTRHDVIAFVSQIAASVGKHGRFVHFGLTSSDVLDTALALQIRRAADVLKKSLAKWEAALIALMEKHGDASCAGRTHGIHAEPTTFGVKMAGFLTELRRNRSRLERAVVGVAVGKLSGAVGTFSAQPEEVEAKVCARLGLRPEPVATQVVPRDRHAEVMWSLAMIGTGLERLAIELRHLQRTEVGEVREGFQIGQKGSSAMPHKRNPISAENLTGAARMLRGYLHPALENVALWHERDISHSSVERVTLADAFVLADYAADRMASLLANLEVDRERMQINMELSRGQLFSSLLLLAMVQKGLAREQAYAIVQELSLNMRPGENLHSMAAADKRVMDYLSRGELDEIFSGQSHSRAMASLVDRARSATDGGLA